MAGSPRAPADSFPVATISNCLATAKIYLPDAEHGFYRAARFDWSGMVASVQYAGHTFFTALHHPQDPSVFDAGAGPSEEFGFDEALGYSQAKPHEHFLKIGVGELIRPDDPAYAQYRFYKRFAFAAAPVWSISRGGNWIDFVQQSTTVAGWSYRYEKRLTLVSGKPELLIEHHLINTGARAIDTTWYCHNFMDIDDRPIGAAYVVKLPFSPSLEKGADPGAMRIDNQTLRFAGPVHASVNCNLMGFSAHDNQATIECNGVLLRITNAQPVEKIHFFITSNVICPEMFIPIRLAPGEKRLWNTYYDFSATEH